MKIKLSILCLFFTSFLFSQNGDCITGITICKKDTLRIDSLPNAGNIINEITTSNAPCFFNGSSSNFVEYSSLWIHWRVAQSGTLTFTITPNNINDDIDFAVFRLANDSCNQKTIVRCMASGSTPGTCTLNGSTGLRLGEVDVSEPAGCTVGGSQNNFLAPLTMQTGESYALWINNYSSFGGVKVSFCGTALLGCETVSCALRTDAKDMVETDFISKLSPNPTRGDVYFDTKYPLSKILIYNCLGQFLKTKAVQNQNNSTMDVSDLQSGSYFIGFETSDGNRVFKKLVKL